MDEIESAVQGKIEADTDFQATLATLSEEEKTAQIATKKSELISQEIKNLREKAAETDKHKAAEDSLRVRAEKAEKQAKKQDENGLSNKDVIYLAKADIHPEDMDFVTEEARLRGISVQDAHKLINPILKVRSEERATAEATAVGNRNRAGTQTKETDLLAQAAQGLVPDDDAGIALLAEQRLQSRLKK